MKPKLPLTYKESPRYSPNNQYPSTYWGGLLAEKQVCITRLGGFVFFSPNVKTSNNMPPDAGNTLVKPSTLFWFVSHVQLDVV